MPWRLAGGRKRFRPNVGGIANGQNVLGIANRIPPKMSAESQSKIPPECGRNRKHLIGEIPPNVRVELGRFPQK